MASDLIEPFDELPVDAGFEYGELQSVSQYFETNGDFGCNLITFQPGEGGPPHYHPAPIEEFYFVLAGTLEIRVGDEIATVDSGAVVFTPSEVVHQPTNTGDDEAVLLTVFGPGNDPQAIPADE